MPGDAERAPDHEPEIADAARLFDEGPAPAADAPKAEPTAASAEEGYDVQETDEPAPPPRQAFVAPEPAPRKAAARPERMTLEPSQAVEQVWSRWAEWGASLSVLTAASAFLLLLIYFALEAEAYVVAAVLFFAGGFGLALLSYPILITLERPVRVTPEQAVKDYYGALSHHLPHFRRMWLLLSRAGRTSGSFASFEGFQNYWRERLARLRGERIAKSVPLKFQVVAFKSPKSSGLSAIDVGYALEVYVRGRTNEGPIATYRIETSLVKGPDRMWYLDLGTLPET